jgi:MATE family multidrug resistance protein
MIFSFLYWGFGFLRMGTTGFTAQALGAGDPRDLQYALIRPVILAAGLSLMIIALQVPAAWVAFRLIAAEPLVESLATSYFDIRIWGAPATLVNYAILGWLLGIQRPRIALLVQVTMNGLNIFLDLLFVVGFGLDIEGVALATVLSEYCAALLGLIVILRIWSQFSTPVGPDPGLSWSHALESSEMVAMFRVNADIFVRTLCLIFAFAIFTAKSATLGTAVLAANAVLMNFQTFMAYGLDGFAHAAEALVGSAKGAKDRRAFREIVAASTVMAAAVAVIYTAVYVVFANNIIGLFTDINSVREEAEKYLVWIYFSPIVSVWAFQLDGIFIGTTRSKEMRNGMIISLVVYLLLITYFPTYFGAHGLWLALLGFLATRAVTLGFWLPRIDRSIEGT